MVVVEETWVLPILLFISLGNNGAHSETDTENYILMYFMSVLSVLELLINPSILYFEKSHEYDCGPV